MTTQGHQQQVALGSCLILKLTAVSARHVTPRAGVKTLGQQGAVVCRRGELTSPGTGHHDRALGPQGSPWASHKSYQGAVQTAPTGVGSGRSGAQHRAPGLTAAAPCTAEAL